MSLKPRKVVKFLKLIKYILTVLSFNLFLDFRVFEMVIIFAYP